MREAAAREALPYEDAVARVCKASTIENGEVTAASFKPRQDATGKYEEYLSTHWLEFISTGSEYSQKISDLRKFLFSQPPKQEILPTKTGLIAVLPVAHIRTVTVLETGSRMDCVYEPRAEVVRDPHSGIYVFPDEDIAELVVRHHLAMYSVAYVEAGLG